VRKLEGEKNKENDEKVEYLSSLVKELQTELDKKKGEKLTLSISG